MSAREEVTTTISVPRGKRPRSDPSKDDLFNHQTPSAEGLRSETLHAEKLVQKGQSCPPSISLEVFCVLSFNPRDDQPPMSEEVVFMLVFRELGTRLHTQSVVHKGLRMILSVAIWHIKDC